jgi:hypothetical protein
MLAIEVSLMPNQVQAPTLLELQKKYALDKIYSDLAEFKHEAAFREIIYSMHVLELNLENDNARDIAIVNEKIRNKLLKIMATENTALYRNKNHLYLKVHNCMLLLTQFWPLNDYEENEDNNFQFLCPMSMEVIENNKILLSTGHQLDPAVLRKFLDFSSQKNSYKDPVTKQLLNHRDVARLTGIVQNTPLTEEEKSKEIAQAKFSGFFVGILSPILVSVFLSLFSSLVYFIPPIIIMPILVIMPLVMMPVCMIAFGVKKKWDLAKRDREIELAEKEITLVDATLKAIEDSASRHHINLNHVANDAPLKPNSSTAAVCNELSISVQPQADEVKPEEKPAQSAAALRDKRQAWLDSVIQKHKPESETVAPSDCMKLA